MKTRLLLSAFLLPVLFPSCATETLARTSRSRMMSRDKHVHRSEFIGIADDRAFQFVELIPVFPWSDTVRLIRWCPLSELSADDLAKLRSRGTVNKIAPAGNSIP